MTSLAEVTLVLARLCTKTLQGNVDSITSTALTDALLTQENDHWTKGALFLPNDVVIRVTASAEGSLTFDALTDTFTAVAATDLCTCDNVPLFTGLAVVLTTTGTLPTGLALATPYYVIRVSDTTFKLATSLANAQAGTQIDITGAGTGVHTMTLTPASAGDRYTVAVADYPYSELVKATNQALAEIGPVLTIDSASATDALTVDSSVHTYTLPSGVSNVVKVKIIDSGDATVYYWSERWTEENGSLVFDSGAQPTNDADLIRLYYLAPHSELVNSWDDVSSVVDLERLKWVSTVYLMRWGLRQYGEGDDRKIAQFLQEAIQRAANLNGRRNRGVPPIRLHVAG